MTELPTASLGASGFHAVCDLDDLWAGETKLVQIGNRKVLVVHTEDGELRAVQGMCPHQAVSLEDAALEGHVLRCPMHLWEMDVVTGQGVNPPHADLAQYAIEVRDGAIFVSVDGVKPKFSRP